MTHPFIVYTLNAMKIEFDNAKNEANQAKHGIDFNRARYFHWHSALVIEDRRKDYAEHRYKAQGFIDGRLHVLIFVIRNKTCRIVSLRKSNARERSFYEKSQ